MIQEEINKALDSIPDITQKSLKVIPEKQGAHLDSMRIYACWFTTFHMYFTYKYPLKFSQTWEELKKNCVKLGGMTDSFSILDESGKKSMIAKAAGFDLIRRDTTVDICQKMLNVLDANQPVPFSLNGEHYELATGYKVINGAMYFEIEDPGYQNDTLCLTSTLEVCHQDKESFVFSKGHNGKTRKITRIYWFE